MDLSPSTWVCSSCSVTTGVVAIALRSFSWFVLYSSASTHHRVNHIHPTHNNNNEQNAEDTIFVVTGASGFVGSHVIKQLLELGYRVRATVRNAQDEAKTKFLRELVPTAKHPLELFSADLTTPGSDCGGCDKGDEGD